MRSLRLAFGRLRDIVVTSAVAFGFTGLPGCASPPTPVPRPVTPTSPKAPAAPASPSSSLSSGRTAQPSGSEGRVTHQGGGPVVVAAVSKVELIPFSASAFPYRGNKPTDGKPFLDVVDGTRRGHTSARGGVYWEDTTYADRRVLLAIPPGFDPRRPALMVVYFHGNLSQLERDVRDRQQVARQLAESGLNAVLVAPQLAVDALDSSPGHFWEPGHFNRFLREASARSAQLYGGGNEWRSKFDAMPVVIVAYSGGYLPAVYSLMAGNASGRVHGLVLLDALYSDEDEVADWLLRHRRGTFFLSAYGASSRDSNLLLQQLLTARHVGLATVMPPRLETGKIAFVDVGDEVDHMDFVTQAWDSDPLRRLLALIPGFSRHQALASHQH